MIIPRRRKREPALFREIDITLAVATDVLLRHHQGKTWDGILKT